MNIAEQVQTAVQNYEGLPQTPLDDTVTPETLYMATPDRLAYALGWIAANAIVSKRFRRSAIDVLPVFHPEHGWDRFLITRRVSCGVQAHRPADEFGLLMLSGEDAPRLTTGGGRTRLSLGSAMREDPDAAIAALLDEIPKPKIEGDKHSRCAHHLSRKYPLYFNTVTELIVENPGLVAAREVYIDDQEIDGQYHPLYLHAVALSSSGPGDRTGMLMPVIVYEWFQLQYGDLFAFFDTSGKRAVYRTDRGTWSRVRKQLSEEPDENVKQRIGNWLRIGGVPDAEHDSPREGAAMLSGEMGDEPAG
jgi:hypothetical protein